MAHTATSDRARTAPKTILPGTQVEVRRKFDRKWARGFELHAATDDGYQLTRCSDGALLPVAFPAADVRPAKNDQA
jgi:hypothetical protein